ncbi:Scr1 family TA system antitoxin-like transcriptional regulator [Streptomyces sp. NPDC127068]|uniref:Scr1 family TA system antitoxin-like transcriptional regulator n=1 Tax=Streptomyces sp. NPDC127068 TaxID=3347127 RepID=UPI003653A88B
MTHASTPPVSWSYCGDQIKLWRQVSSVTREKLSDEANYHIDYVKAMENGRRKPTVQLLTTADHLCNAKGLLVAAQKFLIPEPTRQYTSEFMEAEAKATVINSYETLHIPGLLQTESYCRALFSSRIPLVDDEVVEERTSIRLARQMILRESRPLTWFNYVIFEAALRAHVGSKEVMREQLRHLQSVAQLRNVSLQVLPFNRAKEEAIGGQFVIFDVSGERYGYTESSGITLMTTDHERIAPMEMRYGMLRCQALDLLESVQFIQEIAEEL